MINPTLVQEITQLHADFCSALADSTRLILLYALADGPRNVTELTQELNQPQPTISRHLKILRDRGIGTGNPAGNDGGIYPGRSSGHRRSGYPPQHHA